MLDYVVTSFLSNEGNPDSFQVRAMNIPLSNADIVNQVKREDKCMDLKGGKIAAMTNTIGKN